MNNNQHAFTQILGTKIEIISNKNIVFEATYNVQSLPLLAEHKVYNVVVIPGSFHIARILSLVYHTFAKTQCCLKNISFSNAIILQDGQSRTVQVAFTAESPNEYAVNVLSVMPNEKLSNGAAKLYLQESNIPKHNHNNQQLLDFKLSSNQQIPLLEYHRNLTKDRYQYGPGYIWATEVWSGVNEAIAQMRVPDPSELGQDLAIHPGLIDCSFQVLSACFTEAKNSLLDSDVAYIPIGIDIFNIYSIQTTPLWCHVSLDLTNTCQKTIRANIELFDNEGNMFVQMLGFTAMQAPSAALFKSITK